MAPSSTLNREFRVSPIIWRLTDHYLLLVVIQRSVAAKDLQLFFVTSVRPPNFPDTSELAVIRPEHGRRSRKSLSALEFNPIVDNLSHLYKAIP